MPEVVPDVVPVVVPEVVPLVVVPEVVPMVPEVVPLVVPEVVPMVPEVVPLVVPAFSDAVQALNNVSAEHMMAPVSPKSHLRFIRIGKSEKEIFSRWLIGYTSVYGAIYPHFTPWKYSFINNNISLTR